jgi:hypothetical protein
MHGGKNLFKSPSGDLGATESVENRENMKTFARKVPGVARKEKRATL